MDDERLFSRSFLGEIRVWNKNTGECEITLPGRYEKLLLEGSSVIIQNITSHRVTVFNKYDMREPVFEIRGEIFCAFEDYFVVSRKGKLCFVDKRGFHIADRVEISEEIESVVVEGDTMIVKGYEFSDVETDNAFVAIWNLKERKWVDRYVLSFFILWTFFRKQNVACTPEIRESGVGNKTLKSIFLL